MNNRSDSYLIQDSQENINGNLYTVEFEQVKVLTDQLLYVSKERLDVKLQIYLTTPQITIDSKRNSRQKIRKNEQKQQSVDSPRNLLRNNIRVQKLKKEIESLNEKQRSQTYEIRLPQVNQGSILSIFSDQFDVEIKFLVLCEMCNPFLKNYEMIEKVLMIPKSKRLQILLENILYFRVKELKEQYKFLQRLDGQVLKKQQRMDQKLRWNDYLRFQQYFFEKGQWKKEQSIQFMILMSESLRNKQIGQNAVKRLFLDSGLEIVQSHIDKNELMKIIIQEMSEEQLFVLIQKHLKQY